jgi:hypothetical protein
VITHVRLRLYSAVVTLTGNDPERLYSIIDNFGTPNTGNKEAHMHIVASLKMPLNQIKIAENACCAFCSTPTSR